MHLDKRKNNFMKYTDEIVERHKEFFFVKIFCIFNRLYQSSIIIYKATTNDNKKIRKVKSYEPNKISLLGGSNILNISKFIEEPCSSNEKTMDSTLNIGRYLENTQTSPKKIISQTNNKKLNKSKRNIKEIRRKILNKIFCDRRVILGNYELIITKILDELGVRILQINNLNGGSNITIFSLQQGDTIIQCNNICMDSLSSFVSIIRYFNYIKTVDSNENKLILKILRDDVNCIKIFEIVI